MEKIVRFALAALFLLGIASAQNIPAVDVFGGYSYLNFDVPSSGETTSQRLNRLRKKSLIAFAKVSNPSFFAANCVS